MPPVRVAAIAGANHHHHSQHGGRLSRSNSVCGSLSQTSITQPPSTVTPNENDNDEKKTLDFHEAAKLIQKNWRRRNDLKDEVCRLGKVVDHCRRAEELSQKLMDEYKIPDQPVLKCSDLMPPTTLGELADSRLLGFVVFSCVLVNGVQMGVQADHNTDVLNSMYEALDNVFTGVFAVEMTIKLCAWRFRYFKSLWNVFDFSLTWLSIIDVWILGNLAGDSGGLKMFAVLRILRIFRVVRLLRMLRSLRELALIVQGFVGAMQTTVWVALMLLLILYIFSVFCVQVVGGSDLYPGHNENSDDFEDLQGFNNYQFFGTIPRAMFTLLNCILMADDWYVVGRAILEKQPAVLFLMIVFVLLTSIALLNVVAGILVEHIMTSTDLMNKDADKIQRREMLGTVQKLCKFVISLDADGNGSIDEEELEKAWNRPEMYELLQLANLPLGAQFQDLFYLVVGSGKTSMEIAELVQSLTRLLTNSSDQHILELKCAVHHTLREVKIIQKDMQERMQNYQTCASPNDVTENVLLSTSTKIGTNGTPPANGKAPPVSCTMKSSEQDARSVLSTSVCKDKTGTQVRHSSEVADYMHIILDRMQKLQDCVEEGRKEMQEVKASNEEMRQELKQVKDLLEPQAALAPSDAFHGVTLD